MRASDADRERVVEALRQHAGDGRLTVDELTQRVEHAYAATTVRELEVVLHDLPKSPAAPVPAGSSAVSAVPAILRGRRRRSLGFFAIRLAIIDLACVAIWAATGTRSVTGFWPIWPIVLTAVWFAFRCVRAIERRRAPQSPQASLRQAGWELAARQSAKAVRRASRR